MDWQLIGKAAFFAFTFVAGLLGFAMVIEAWPPAAFIVTFGSAFILSYLVLDR